MNERLHELYLEAAEHMKKVQDQGLPAPYQTRALAGKLAELIVQECCDWIDGSPANDAGQLHLTKSFIIVNLKGMFKESE